MINTDERKGTTNKVYLLAPYTSHSMEHLNQELPPTRQKKLWPPVVTNKYVLGDARGAVRDAP